MLGDQEMFTEYRCTSIKGFNKFDHQNVFLEFRKKRFVKYFVCMKWQRNCHSDILTSITASVKPTTESKQLQLHLCIQDLKIQVYFTCVFRKEMI